MTILPTKKREYLLILILFLLLVIANMVTGYIAHLIGRQRSSIIACDKIAFYFSIFITIICAPISEEFFWRGYALDQFKKVAGPYAAVFLCASFFSLWHVPVHGIYSLSAFAYGIVLGLWRIHYKALLPLIIAHILLNALVVYRINQFMWRP